MLDHIVAARGVKAHPVGAAADIDGRHLVAFPDLGQPRLDQAKGDTVHIDAVRAPFFGEGARHADESRLGRRVSDLGRAAVEPRDRRDVDYLAVNGFPRFGVPVARIAEKTRRGAEDPKRRNGVDIEHRLELLVAGLVDAAVPHIARVVDQNVDTTESIEHVGDDAIAVVRLADVAGEDRRAAPLGLDLGGDPPSRIFVDVGNHDGRSRGGEFASEGGSDAPPSAGDEGDAP